MQAMWLEFYEILGSYFGEKPQQEINYALWLSYNYLMQSMFLNIYSKFS